MKMPFQLVACPVCKSIGLNRGLCLACRDELWRRREPIARELSGFKVRSLFRWQEGAWPGLGWWLRSLKRKEDWLYWREPALWALNLFPRPSTDRALVVPVPGSKPRANHALGLARALAGWMRQWEVADCLLAVSEGSQKSQAWEDRWLRRFELKDRSILACKDYTLLVVDDVVTSGATACAAVQALGRPEGCEVWTLADRRPCCGDRAALL